MIDKTISKILHAIPDLVSITRASDGLFVYVNPAYIDTFKYTEEEIIGKTVFDLNMWVDPDKRAALIREIEKIGELAEVDMDHRAKDGQIVSMSVSYSLIEISGDKCIVEVGRDVTERKFAEEALRLQSYITYNLSEGVCLHGMDDIKIVYTNPRFEAMFGYGPGEMLGQPVTIINAPSERTPEQTAAEILEVIRKTGEWHGEVNNIKKDGTPFWCYANAAMFDHRQYGKVMVFATTDITERGCVKRGSSSERSCEIIASLSYWSKWLMKRFIEGENRSQSTLFPESLEDDIGEDNAVRVVDAFVDTLDLKQLGFERAEPSVTGRPGYQPATMLKIYVYGYLNRLQSSRRLERESHRNVELIWLTGRLMPDFKTIADLRKDNRKAIRRVCAEFVGVCRELELFSATLVAIDGSKFKAVNSRDKNFTRQSVERRLKKTQANIDRYLAKLDAVDREEPEIQEVTAAEIKQKIASMEAKMEELKGHEGAVEAHPDNQVSLTDPDARSMMKAGGGSVVGYNVQTAVDSKHHLIAAHEVTNAPTDRSQLSSMAAQATTALDPKALTVIADPGYYKGEEIRACYEAGVMALVPKPRTSGNKAVGLYEKQDFHYESEADQYRCPAGEVLAHRHNGIENGMKMPFYYASVLVCRECTLKSQCTLSKERRIRRWEHESVLDDAEVELKQHPDAMRQRKRLVEHPYGTIKHWMGSTHFLMKRLPNVQAEMSLHVLAYNLRRAINILGVPKIIEQLQTA